MDQKQERDFQRGMFPLVALRDDRLYPIATASCISKIGILLTAEHNLRDALRYHDRGDIVRGLDNLPQNLDLRGLGLSVIWRHEDSNRGRVAVWPIQHLNGAPPTDVMFAYPEFQSDFEYMALKMTFDLPRIGSVVRLLGYSDMQVSEDITLSRLRDGELYWPAVYSHHFQSVEARVREIFTQGFAKRSVEGACFVVDAEVPHGLSGGPVFNEDGKLCGIISAGATMFMDYPATLVSLLYPLLLTPIKISATLGVLSMSSEQLLIDYVASGAISTDGSELGVNVTFVGKQPVVGPRVHRDDVHHVFDDFKGYQAGRRASPYVGEGLRFKRHEDDLPPDRKTDIT